MTELDKSYDASQVESKVYQTWQDSGYFTPENLPDSEQREPFTIMLPPPNVTGTLHMGHAFEDTMQDIIVRYKRMAGFRTLWLPGTDHAPIATESKVAKLLEKEQGLRKHDLGREEFVKKVEQFAQDSHDTIISKIKTMGASVDWTREAYTFDQHHSLAVRTAFTTMYDAGLIYKADKVVNWDPKGQTVISDDEVKHEERETQLYTFRYSSDFPIPIATTRPETKLGDTAVAVHPNDQRYQQYIGQEFDLEFCGVPLHIKIIADELIDPEFGTGALGVTPAHSLTDYDMALRYDLPLKPVINELAKMTVGNADILGKKTTDAREAVVNWLRQRQLLEKEETIKHNVSTSERTGAIIEPLPKLQWFISVTKEFTLAKSEIPGLPAGSAINLKQLMRHVVENGAIKIVPERFSKTYFHWIDNLRDWCISRQLWFGHRIPAWYTDQGDKMYVGLNAPTANDAEALYIKQDTDTLDTWFSSSLWTFSTLGWPNKSSDLKTFHPTSIVTPGYDILFFWVARMILMSGFLLGQVPFQQVYLHGMVRDSQGRKFSKSLNNGVDPLDMTTKYGTDALRMALISGVAPGNDIVFDEQKVKGMKHFGNKLWNIARFILTNVESTDWQWEALTEADQQIIESLNKVLEQTTADLDQYRLHEAAQLLYQFTWHELADVYLETSKAQLQNPQLADNTKKLLLHVLITVVKLLHPFMPFLTEHLWHILQDKYPFTEKTLLIACHWPKPISNKIG